MVRPFCFATVDSIPYDAALHRHKSSASEALKLGLGDVRTRGGAPRCMAGAWLELLAIWGCGPEWGGQRRRSMARAVEAPRCVAPADWRRQMQVRAAAWPIGGSITPACRGLIAQSRPLRPLKTPAGIRDANLIHSS
ncbi:hypothetical protein V8C43DRAFT_112177 [Trichoderma afarasin]